MIAAKLSLPVPIDILRNKLQKRGVLKASVFGSYARGEQRPDSDLDILVEYAEGVSLFDHFDLKDDLEKLTGKKVDVVSARAVSKHFAPYINKDKVEIL